MKIDQFAVFRIHDGNTRDLLAGYICVPSQRSVLDYMRRTGALDPIRLFHRFDINRHDIIAVKVRDQHVPAISAEHHVIVEHSSHARSAEQFEIDRVEKLNPFLFLDSYCKRSTISTHNDSVWTGANGNASNFFHRGYVNQGHRCILSIYYKHLSRRLDRCGLAMRVNREKGSQKDCRQKLRSFSTSH